MTQRPAGLVYGFWGQNIGNAFFNIGGAHVVRTALEQRRLVYLQDQPAYWTFRNERKGNYSNAFGFIAHADVDPLIVQGPVFTQNFGAIWEPTFHHLQRQGRSWGGVGVALRKYTTTERQAVAETLRRFPPRFLSTRDRDTFDYLSGLGLSEVALHDGIDSAFFCGLCYEPPRLNVARPLTCLTFDHFPEPRLIPAADGPVQIGDTTYRLSFSRIREQLARLGKTASVLIHTFPGMRSYQQTYRDGTIIRPTHRTNPHMPFVIYRRGGAFASDEPYSYLALYAAADLTISDRIHACVATLIHGGRAMLHNPLTKRSALLNRVGCEDISERPVHMPHQVIRDEFVALQTFLSEYL